MGEMRRARGGERAGVSLSRLHALSESTAFPKSPCVPLPRSSLDLIFGGFFFSFPQMEASLQT